MKNLILKSLLVAGASALVAACETTPSYPTGDGRTPGPGLPAPQPSFPTRTAPPEDPAPSAAPTSGGIESGTLTPVSPPGAVTSTPVAPVASAPPARPPEMRTVTTTSVTGPVVDATGAPKTYTVKAGDTLYGIARSQDTTVKQLTDDNKLSEPFRLQPGQTLKLPAAKAKAYVVQTGDTLFAIARRFSVEASAIAEANEMGLNDTIRRNQKLVLPAGYRDRGPVTRTTQVAVAPPPPPAYTPPAYTPPAPTPAPAAPAAAAATGPDLSPTPPVFASATPPATPVPARTTTPAPAASAPVRTQPPAAATPQPSRAPVTTPPVTTPPAARPPVVATAPAPTPAPAARPPATTPSAAAAPRNPVPAAPALPQATASLSDSAIAAAGQGRFAWPLQGEIITGFGRLGTGRQNDGIDIRATAGAPVRSSAAGEVVYAGDQVPGFGNLVLIKHDGGWVTAYAHLSNVDVKMQQRVTQGQQIGQAGATGGASENKLHFEVRYAPSPADKARPIDPRLVLPR